MVHSSYLQQGFKDTRAVYWVVRVKMRCLHESILFSAKCPTKGKGDDGRCAELPKQRSHSRGEEESTWTCITGSYSLHFVNIGGANKLRDAER